MEKLKKYKRSRYEMATIKPSQIKTETINGEARICIEDTYTKAGVKYYVITTDGSGFSRFILSEDEYGEYIGLGNDAVDCTIYTLYCASDIYKDYYFLEDIGHLEATENTKDYSFHSDILDSPYYIDSAYGKCFANERDGERA